MTHGEFATDQPWVTKVKGSRYGTDDTYKLAAEWLSDCRDVADWGGGRGHFKQFLPPTVRYTLVDGTHQTPDTVVADLKSYHEPSDGILLRHVLEMTADWEAILRNAVEAFRKKLVLVTFTPSTNKPEPKLATHHLMWPVFHFSHSVHLIPIMKPFLVHSEAVRTTQPERVYYLRKS